MSRRAELDVDSLDLSKLTPGQRVTISFDKRTSPNTPARIDLTVVQPAQTGTEEGSFWTGRALADIPARQWNSANLDPSRGVRVQIGGVFPFGKDTAEALKQLRPGQMFKGQRLVLSSVGEFPRAWFMPGPISRITVR